jgi:hypothetical protein
MSSFCQFNRIPPWPGPDVQNAAGQREVRVDKVQVDVKFDPQPFQTFPFPFRRLVVIANYFVVHDQITVGVFSI